MNRQLDLSAVGLGDTPGRPGKKPSRPPKGFGFKSWSQVKNSRRGRFIGKDLIVVLDRKRSKWILTIGTRAGDKLSEQMLPRRLAVLRFNRIRTEKDVKRYLDSGVI